MRGRRSESDGQKLGNDWILGCEQWIYEWASEFWRPYYINVMFKPMLGSGDHLIRRMRSALERDFYPRLATLFVHHPRAASEQGRLPKLILFPDRSVWKRRRENIRTVILNESLHYNGVLLTPPISRLNRCPVKVIAEKQQLFTRGDLARVHVMEMYDVEGCSDYSGKTVKWGRASESDIILLPRSATELSQHTKQLAPCDRAVRDLQSRSNLSDATARKLVQAAASARKRHD